jgi:PilZ domain
MKERRSTARTKSFLQGRIFYNHRRSSIDCLVRDYSDIGAKLKISEAIAVPEAMELYIPNRDEIRRARVQWRAGDEMGVEFYDEESPSIAPAMPASDLVARVATLEHDYAALKRVVTELRAEISKLHGGAI